MFAIDAGANVGGKAAVGDAFSLSAGKRCASHSAISTI
jgi:hypothetical protein